MNDKEYGIRFIKELFDIMMYPSQRYTITKDMIIELYTKICKCLLVYSNIIKITRGIHNLYSTSKDHKVSKKIKTRIGKQFKESTQELYDIYCGENRQKYYDYKKFIDTIPDNIKKMDKYIIYQILPNIHKKFIWKSEVINYIDYIINNY